MKKRMVFAFASAAVLMFSSLVGPAYAGTITVSNVKVLDVTKSSARISWDTNVNASQGIMYGPTSAYGYWSGDWDRGGIRTPITPTTFIGSPDWPRTPPTISAL